MKKLRVWILATLWFASVSGLSAYGVICSWNAPRGNHSGDCGRCAIASLRAYLGAQSTFRRVDRYGKGKLVYANTIDGEGLPDLWRIGGTLEKLDGTELKLIDLAFARATSPNTAKSGYWYVEITGDAATGPYDHAQDFGLCAVPAVYGKTGLHTFIVDLTGTVYKKDTRGTPVRVYPDIEKEGWVPVGM